MGDRRFIANVEPLDQPVSDLEDVCHQSVGPEIPVEVTHYLMNFDYHFLSISVRSVSSRCKEYDRALYGQKIYSAAKDFTKEFLASFRLCSRLCSGVKRAIASTPAMLGNNSLNFEIFSSRV